MPHFNPTVKKEISVHQIAVRVSPAFHDRLKDAAAAHGISLQSFCTQALEYALDNMETD